MKTARMAYASFLVRLWREPPTEDTPIVVSVQVEHIPDDERRYFTSIEQLCAYLHKFVRQMPAEEIEGGRGEHRGIREDTEDAEGK